METEKKRMEPAGVGVFFPPLFFSQRWWVARCRTLTKMSSLGSEVLGSESSRASGYGGDVGVGMNKEA